jgi:uncharacterized protein YhaN
MRFRRLDLIRYGIFTDRPIDLPGPDGTGEPDFHLIVGPNEAGKSTIRHAISDLLFGIKTRTRFDFLHGKTEMRLGAMLENGDAQLEFHRLKRNKQPLRRLDDDLLPDDALAPYTGNADRTSFEREFCLDHARLAAGGQSILNSKDDVGRMLFEASAGVGVFGDFLDQLDEEADGLWSRRYSKDREFYRALDAFNEAKRAVKEATARTKEWKDANTKIAEASESLTAAKDGYEALERTRTRLDRVRRVATHFQTRKTKIDELAALGDVIALPENAAEDLNAVQIDLVNADRLLLEHQALIDKAVKDRDGVSVDETLLSRKDDIIALREERSRIKDHPLGLAKREAESQALSENIKTLVLDLEWDTTDEESLDSALPSAIARKEIETLANSHGRLDQTATSTAENVTGKERDLAAWSDDLKTLPDLQLPPNIKPSLTEARSLGNTEDTKLEFENRIKLANDQLEIEFAKLRPWTGSVQNLRQLAVPSDEEVQEYKNKERDIDIELKSVQEQHEETEDELKALETEESRFQESRQPVTPEDIVSSRSERDDLWEKIRSGIKTVDEAGDDYETRVTTADDLTDHRYQNAEEAKELEHLRGEIARLRQKRGKQDGKIEKIEEQRGKLMTGWGQITVKLGLGDMSISAVQTWLGHYRIALSEAEKLTDEEASLRGLETRETAAATGVKQALAQAGIKDEKTAPLKLRRLIDEVESVVSEAETAKAQREQLEDQLQRGRDDLAGLKDKAAKAQQELDAWNELWLEKTKAAGLPDKVTPQTATTALALMVELKEKLKENRELKQSRIKTMRRDIENFGRSAETLAQAIAPDLTGKPAEDICSTLCQQLTEAESGQKTFEKAEHDIEENTAHRNKVQTQKNEAEARLAPHMERAKVDNIADLETAIGRSENLRLLNSAIEEATTVILELGDGLSLDNLEAEVADEDLTTIAARLDDVKEQSGAAMTLRDDCVLQKENAEAEKAKIHGQADAATAEAQRQEALARMAAVTERFIKVHMGARLLRWSIERYREEKRGPLLERASKIFSTLTLGSFQTLEIDYDGDTPQLMGRRPNGNHVDFDGLSDGTGDQLFLSLRLAAVEMQLQHAQPLPFIADDLFINYSDNRATQGFKALSDLATQSQVIYFTHHDHLVEVAREAIGKDLSVIRL